MERFERIFDEIRDKHPEIKKAYYENNYFRVCIDSYSMNGSIHDTILLLHQITGIIQKQNEELSKVYSRVNILG